MIDLRFWRKREKFLLLEVMPEKTTALFLSVDADQHLRVDEEKHNVGPKELAAYLEVHRAKNNIVVSADPSLVVTAILPVHIDRANSGAPLTAIELENLLSKAIGQVFNQCRTEASKDLGVDDLDTILVNSQVIHFKVDGHQVLDPVGFNVRTIEAILELTLTTRGVFERLKTLLKTHKTFFFTESGRSELASLKKIRPLPITLVSLGAGQSTYFVMHRAAIGHHIVRANLTWRTTKFRDILAGAFGISHETAQSLYALYLMRSLSSPVMKHFEKLLKPGVLSLLAELKLAKLRGAVYVSTDLMLPFSLPHKNGGYILTAPPLHELLEAFGLGIEEGEWGAPGRVLTRLAPFLEYYYAKNNSQVNEWLKRHLNWLGASV